MPDSMSPVTATALADGTAGDLLDLVPDAIFARGSDRRIIFWSKGAEATYGFTRQDALGRVPGQLLGTEYPIPLEQIEQAVMEQGIWEGDLIQHAKDGSTLTVASRWAARRDREGRVTQMLEINRDITARLQAQAQSERLIHEAERERLRRRLSQAQHMESLGQLAGGIAHDFNNLLSVIINYSAFVTEGIDRASNRAGTFDPCELQGMREDVEQVRKAGERAANLTRQLLAFARREEVTPEVIDVNEVVRSTEQLLRRTLGEHIQLVSMLGEALDPVLMDPGRLEQVLINLAVNARDAMPDGGLLRIDTANVEVDETCADSHPSLRVGPHVRLRVSDTGTGMPPEVASRAFDPFYTTKAAGEGTGLGLATVYGIVKQAGGYVQIYSEQGMGTTFTALVPVTARPTKEAVSRSSERAQPLDEHGEATILMVEDEDALRELTRRILASAGYEVIVAANGPEALRAASLHREQIDLLLTDVIMPQMHGPALARRIRSQRPEIKVLLMSGFAQPVLNAGGRLPIDMPLLDKPFSGPQLLTKVAEQLSGRPRPVAEVR
jgi:PAS domain S-box-containing protein